MPVNDVAKYYLSLINEHEIDKINFLSIPALPETGIKRLQNLRVLQCKDRLSPYAFAYMGMWHGVGKEDYLIQLKKGMAQGFDGLKIIEGKPNVQKYTGIRIWSDEFDDMFSYAEEQQVPILMHVADPAYFWHKVKMPLELQTRGWCYDNPGFLTKEEFHEDIYRLLDKHPRLCVTLAHFFFMSDDMKKASEIFNKYPNVYFDITPGAEMYGNFGEMYDETREFFIKYADRIILGTDVNDSGLDKYEYHSSLYHLTTNFLTGKKEDVFPFKRFQCVPLELPKEIANKIKRENFIRLLGHEPKKINYINILEELEFIESIKETLDRVEYAEFASVREYFFSKAKMV